MLAFSWGCEPWMPVLAACACASVAVEASPPGRAAVEALDLGRSWAEGKPVSAEKLAAASRAAMATEGSLRPRSRARSALYAAAYACDAAYVAAIGGGWSGSCRSAAISAGNATGGERKFVPIVRRYVSLGAVLAGILLGEE